MIWFWIIFAILVLVVLYIFARPENVYDGARGGYVVVNTLMGYPCLEGRMFRTARGAERAMNKLAKNNIFNLPGTFVVMRAL